MSLRKHAFLVVLALVISAVLLGALGWLLSGWLGIRSSADRFKVVETFLASLGGLGAAVGLVVTFRRQKVLELRQQMQEDEALTQRFSSFTGQLGSDKTAIRLAGVHSLFRLADAWEQERQTLIDVLCAYLRLPWDMRYVDAGEGEVRSTIMRLVIERLRDGGSLRILPYSFDFTGAVFPVTLLAEDVIFPGRVSFSNAVFKGEVIFKNVTFSKDVSFNHAVFEYNTYFDQTKFDGVAQFGRAVFNGDVYFSDVMFGSTEKVVFNSAAFKSTASFYRMNTWPQGIETPLAPNIYVSNCTPDETV